MKRILIIGGLILIAACASAREYALVQDIGDATVKLRGMVISEEFWLGNRNVFEQTSVRLGGWQMHLYMAENEDDYVWCLFEIDEGASLTFDENARLVFVYEDGSRVVSEELIFADGRKEMQIFVTTDEVVGLTAGPSRYGRSRHGGFLATVRFRRGSLPYASGEWGYVPPEKIEILRGE